MFTQILTTFSRASEIVRDMVDQDDVVATSDRVDLLYSNVMDKQFVIILQDLRTKLNNRVVTLYANPNQSEIQVNGNEIIQESNVRDHQREDETFQTMRIKLEECYAEMRYAS